MTALLSRERLAPPAAAPFVTVIVPVRNEERFIRRTLEQLVSQDYPADRFEVLVADGRSTDTTRAVVSSAAARHPNVRLLDNPRRWSSAGRNAAVRAARGDLLVLIDGHCELDNPHYLAELVRAFERSGADCVGRPQPLDVPGASPLRRAIAAARSSPLGHNPDSFIYASAEGFVRPQSVAIAYRREVFDRVGLFDESFDACEDVEFNHRLDRAGLRCFFTPRVAVRYHPRGTLAGLFRQMARYGRGRVRLLRKHPETFGLGCFVPAAFLLGVIAGPVAALLSPWLAVAYGVGVGAYLLAVLLASVWLTAKARDLRVLPWLPLVFVAIHVGAGAGLLLEGIAGARREGATRMNVVHLTASTLFGGPERQMLGLAGALAGECHSAFLSFNEGGRCRAFLEEAERQGFEAASLKHDTPHLRAATRELTVFLRRAGADVLLCNGYKASLLGRIAARRVGIPAVAVSRGWTAENWKVGLYEAADRANLRWMDRVVCVSEGQAMKVRRTGVPAERVVVIRNAIRAERFDDPDPAYRERLLGLFPDPPRRIIGAAGRLSPEKGFSVLIEAARRVLREDPAAGVVLFGDGALRGALARQIEAAGLAGRFVLAGFRADLDCYIPWLDVMALPSYTEGLPNVVLEACAAGVPVVATAVGGTPEVIEDGENGYLAPPGDARALAGCLLAVFGADDGGRGMGECGRRRVREEFTFEAQAEQYRRLFSDVTGRDFPFSGGSQNRRAVRPTTAKRGSCCEG